jgi:hypothetical protein
MQLGHQSGRLQGVKGGNGQANKHSGMKQGLHKLTQDKSHSQDPAELRGIKKPLIFCISDFYTQPSNIETRLLDLCGSGYALFCNAGGSYRPQPLLRDIFYNKTSMDFVNPSCYLVPTPTLSLTGYNALTTIMVVRLKGQSTKAVFTIDDTTTPGGLNILIEDTDNRLSSTFRGGQAGSVTSSKFETYKASGEMWDWMIITSKVRLGQPQGAGSEQELYINGNLQKKFVASNFNVITTAFAAGQNIIVGNDNSILSGTKGNGIKLGGIVVLPYWANETEQIRIENYWRSYYGNKF